MTPVQITERELVGFYKHLAHAVTEGLFNLLDTENRIAECVQDYL